MLMKNGSNFFISSRFIACLVMMGLQSLIMSNDAMSQGVGKNTFSIGGDASFFTTTQSDDPSISLYLSPFLEYFAINNGALGFKYIIDFSKLTDRGFTKISTKRIFQPYIKCYLYKDFFLMGGTQFDSEYRYQSNIQAGVGYTFHLNNTFGVTPLFEINHNFYKYAPNPWQFFYSLGFSYYFNFNKCG